MATAAFKSTTRRTPMGTSSTTSAGDSSSSNSASSVHRRARSLSRFSHRLPAQDSCYGIDELPAPRGRFVNTVRGSGFPEISLDDLAIEFFESANRGRLTSRLSESRPASGTSASQRRGRSVSRKSSGVGDNGKASIGSTSRGGRVVSDANPRRRSDSVVRYQISDSESDMDHSQNSRSHTNLKNIDIGNKQMPNASYQRPALRRSFSQKDMRSCDGYSSQSSVLTDDEGTGIYYTKNGIENIRAVYAQNKVVHPGMNDGLHKVTRKELRHGPDNIKIKLEQDGVKPRTSTLPTVHRLLSNNSDVIQSASPVRRNYKSKLEQSEKLKQGLLDELALEEQCGSSRQNSKVVKEMLPDAKNKAIEKPSRARKRSNDRSRMSKRLTEEAERIIEDFISSVEDTDFSSFEGERSDASSSIGEFLKPEPFKSPPTRSLPVAVDGVSLPWLQWQTNYDASAICLNKTPMPVTPISANSVQEIKSQDQYNHSASNCGSWSPGSLPEYVGKDLSCKFGESCNCRNQSFHAESKGMRYDMDEYLKVKRNEDFLIERWKQQRRINSGGLLLCNPRLF